LFPGVGGRRRVLGGPPFPADACVGVSFLDLPNDFGRCFFHTGFWPAISSSTS